MEKSLQNLHGLPKVLMRLPTLEVCQNHQTEAQASLQGAWSKSTPKLLRLQEHLILAVVALGTPLPVVASLPQNTGRYHTHVDVSLRCWRGAVMLQGKEAVSAAEFWTSDLDCLHSTHKEAQAPLNMVEAVGGLIPPRTQIRIHSDCSSVVWGLHWGSAKP